MKDGSKVEYLVSNVDSICFGAIEEDDFIPVKAEDTGLKFEFDDDEKTASVIGYTMIKYDLEIPKKITFGGDTYTVTSIGSGAFMNASKLKSVKIPNSVTSIDEATFYGCSSLASIEIPNTITSIGREAFQDCSSLTSITIPESVTSMSKHNKHRDSDLCYFYR